MPPTAPFPLPYTDDFECKDCLQVSKDVNKGITLACLYLSAYSVPSEPKYFADQTGVFETYDTNSSLAGKVLRQVKFINCVHSCFSKSVARYELV